MTNQEEQDLKMPESYSYFKDQIRRWIYLNISKKFKILDVGPGCGTYALLLPDFDYIDCVEVFEPYVDRFYLKLLYRNVFISNIMDFKFDYYDFIILGDVLEHLSKEDGIKLIDEICTKCKQLLVAVPYLYEQVEVEGNKYEIHLQSDLTQEIMSERYPQLKLLMCNEKYGYYIKK